LTGMRWAAAFLVFGFHLHVERLYAEGPAADVLRFVFAPGPVGVSFFFILSGFVLAWSARPADTPRAFWRRRAAKLLPNHLVTMAVVLVAFIVLGTKFTVAAAGSNAVLLQGWFPDESVYFGMNTPSWSLSCEAFFYLLFPALWLFLRGASTRVLALGAGVMIGAIWTLPAVALALPDDVAYWFVWILPVSRLPEFVLGICAARLVAVGSWPRVSAWAAGLAFVAAYLASPSLGRWGFVAATSLPLVFLIAATARRDVAGAPSFWRAAPLVTLGNWSFAFYLVHQIVIRFAASSGHSALVGTLWAFALLAAALAAAATLHKLVEVPGMKRFSKPRLSARPPGQGLVPGLPASLEAPQPKVSTAPGSGV
jgi:peptidoglycan/LPS O-acetylase OafA/YrhL